MTKMISFSSKICHITTRQIIINNIIKLQNKFFTGSYKYQLVNYRLYKCTFIPE